LVTKKELWQSAIAFEAKLGGLCGITLTNLREGRGELTLFFDALATEETQFYFETYVASHLEKSAIRTSILRHRIFTCSKCQLEMEPTAVRRRREYGFGWMLCPVCGETRISLADGYERLTVSPNLSVADMNEEVDKKREWETIQTILRGKRLANDYDVFLCHHDPDKPSVKKVANMLLERGVLPWLDEWELQPGLPWQRALEQQIQTIRSAAIFVGGTGIGPWENLEIEA